MDPDSTDEIDHELLRLLARDGRATFTTLAAEVGLSVAATKRRVDRLRDLGIITGFSVQIDHTKLGWQVEAFTEVRYLGSGTPEDMVEIAQHLPEVESIWSIAGDLDALVHLRARDHKHLQAVINKLRKGRGINGTKTLIALSEWRRGEH
ncbi:Lrp/AsnC family transcriptional regulator [Actinoplanes sp. NPDC049265]|uniref:Lrp/AsnC family transcriptional regulator n=1 Tax=Actinoplanes sp. NPDC049265 TaxID=3363902 RepID=UPI00371B78CE